MCDRVGRNGGARIRLAICWRIGCLARLTFTSAAAQKILMSGDHGQEDYDEVNAMKKYAVEKGVAADDVYGSRRFSTL